MSTFDKINRYIDQNFYPFIITVVAHVVIAILFVVLNLTIPTNRYEVVMELDPEMLEDVLEELEEENQVIQDQLAQAQNNNMLTNQASLDGGTPSSGGSGNSGGATNYGLSPDHSNPEPQRNFDWKHDDERDESTYTSVFEDSENDVPFVGESNTSYNIGNRTRFSVFEPKPHYMCPEGGKVWIDVQVNKSGYVTKAEVNPAKSTTTSECLIKAATEFAKEFVFTEGDQKDGGYILFNMQAQ